VSAMSRGDRDQLIRLVKARARQAKGEAERRAAVMQAEIEQEVTAEYEAGDSPGDGGEFPTIGEGSP